MANDELYTPKHIFDALGISFDLDVCAPKEGPLNTPAAKWYSLEDDGLISPWFGKVWMNPPFSKPAPWVERWMDHKNGIALLPLSGNSRWWRKLWESEAAMAMVAPNTGFINPFGKEQKIMYGISLWALGDECVNVLNNSKIGKLR